LVVSYPQQPYQPQPPIVYGPAHLLDQAVAHHVRMGWAVESRTPTMAVLVSGQPINHVLHLLLTVFTCGVWLIIWAVISMLSSMKRLTLILNPDGTISHSVGRS
jgi:hypothetical protein